MATRSDALPQLGGGIFLTDGGLETDLIFHHGVDLPLFASYVLLDDPAGTALLDAYYLEYLRIAAEHGHGLVVETPTWRASRDWGAELGHDAGHLADVNRRGVAHLRALVEREGSDPVVVSGCIGPRGDAYTDLGSLSAEGAAEYHAAQVAVLAAEGVDVVSAFTLTNVDEAIGIVHAAEAADVPVVISFTVETDGRLPTGMDVTDAVAAVDEATGAATAYYLLNCAHHDHFGAVLAGDDPALRRIRGARANASKLSHAELDESEELDDGDPAEFGTQLAQLHAEIPHLTVLGGCCGTDARHLEAVAQSLAAR